MTGIEMLRKWANELREADRAYRDGEIGYVPIDIEACQRKNTARLDAIADQIELETLPRPLFEDGIPVQFGDVAMLPEQDRSFKVDRIEVYDNGWFAVSQHEGCGITAMPGFMFKRPEPPDSWEKLATDIEDCDGSACRYFGRNEDEGRAPCCGCKAYSSETDCTVQVMSDVLSRAKKLAGVEE